MIGRNDFCWCGSGKKWKKCHYPKENPSSSLRELYKKKYDILLKTDAEIAGIRASCKLASSILDATAKMAKAGVTTLELNNYAHRLHEEAGARPAPLGYGNPPFPKSICTSLNDVICHGIPDSLPLKEGDILNIDVTTILSGYYGDCSRMVAIGTVSPEKANVMEVAYQCLMNSIAILKPGVLLNAIGEVIETYATAHGCSVVHQFIAHGVGVHFHEKPELCHHRNFNTTPLVPGMTFTIEPMINAGRPDAVIDADEWTARTIDHKPSAQWEHTLLITENGHEILTCWRK